VSAPVHLDTSYLIRGLVAGSPEARRLGGWIAAGTPLAMSTLAWCEFLCGPVDEGGAALAEKVIRQRPPLGVEEARAAARLFNATGRRRGSLADCIVAATAMLAGASLATANPRDFARFEAHGLTLVG